MRRSLAALLVSALLPLITAGCGARLNTAPDKLTLSGDVTVKSGLGKPTEPCEGTSDIHLDAPVVVRDSAGKTVALGGLQAGAYVSEGEGMTNSVHCTFSFRVTDVPSGDGFYSIEVANRGKVNVGKENVAAPIHLTIGS